MALKILRPDLKILGIRDGRNDRASSFIISWDDGRQYKALDIQGFMPSEISERASR
jgi:hypothetical protein